MYTTAEIIEVLVDKNYVVFQNDVKPYNLNYVGIRDTSGVNTFNDVFSMFWRYKGEWSNVTWKGTTDPGTYWLEHPMNPHGTAILKEGQWRGCWKLGLHQGKYEALVQRKEVTVIRDGNEDNTLNIEGGYEDTGFFGINHHRANAKSESTQIDKWSAGCQVTANPNEYDVFIQICKEAQELWGEGITYTLLNKNDFK